MKCCHIVISAVTETLEEALPGPGGRCAPETAARAGRSLYLAEGAEVFHVPGTEIFSLQDTERNT